MNHVHYMVEKYEPDSRIVLDEVEQPGDEPEQPERDIWAGSGCCFSVLTEDLIVSPRKRIIA